MRKAVITPDGIEVLFPDDEVYLDSTHIRRTVQCIMAESAAYKEERRQKREQRKLKRKFFWK